MSQFLRTFFFIFFTAWSATQQTIRGRLHDGFMILVAIIGVGEFIELAARAQRRAKTNPLANLERLVSFCVKVAASIMFKYFTIHVQYATALSPGFW